MARFAMLNTTAPTLHPLARPQGIRDGDAEPSPCGCAWLFRVQPQVDDVAEAARAAVLEFFATEQGRRIRQGEELTALRWEDAVAWVPDEVWERHGLEAIRHPDVERVMLDGEEDLSAELEIAPPPA